MDDTELQDQDLVGQIINHADPGAFVTKYILLAEVIDTEGDRAVWLTGSDDLTRWDTYGMLTEALMVEKAKHLETSLREDDGE